jgi:hypothetical protein
METSTVAANKKKAARLGAHIVFADESGFLLLPHVAKTWAPVGQTPIHRHVYRRDKISVISGISVSPKRQRLNLYPPKAEPAKAGQVRSFRITHLDRAAKKIVVELT